MSLPFFSYMLRCADGTYYIGHTDNLEARLAEHNHGRIPGYTSTRRPVELVWNDTFPSRIEALEAERKIKGWSRARKAALIQGERGQLGPARANGPPKAQAKIDHKPPVIVLVRPQLGENIGKAARAMLNFGLTELRLVESRDGWPNPSAGPAAAGADLVLAGAQVYPTLADAVADCVQVYATTVRKRGVTKPVLTPEQAAQAVWAEAGRSAFVFGAERSGLETEDVALARAIVTVPINPEFSSLNLAQAVILMAYEWSKQTLLAQPTVEELLPPAPQEDLEGMIAQLETMLEPTRYFYPPGRAETNRLTLRTVLTKPGWNHLEVRTLRGVLSALRKGPRRD